MFILGLWRSAPREKPSLTRRCGTGYAAVCNAVLVLAMVSVPVPAPGGVGATEAPKVLSLFRRGVSEHLLLNWGNLRPDDRVRYAEPPFTGPNHSETDAVFGNVARAEFDFVRLTVDPGPFLQFSGVARAALDDHLIGEVARLRRSGLAVMVDLHPVEQVPLYGRGMTAPGARPGMEAYRGLVARIAARLGALRTDAVALELMNEPDINGPESRARWQDILETLHAAARAEAPDLLLVLSGAGNGSIAGLEQLDARPFRGSNVMYTFHYYEPFIFTHQGVPGDDIRNDPRRFLTGLPYPSNFPFDPVSLVDCDVAADPNIDATRRRRLSAEAVAQASAYAAGGFGRDRIRRDFDRATAWASGQSVSDSRILLGEFSVSRHSADHAGADPISAEAWLRDVRQEAERHGFAWAYWVLSDAVAMQLVTHDGGSTLDPGVLAALGLRDPAASQ